MHTSASQYSHKHTYKLTFHGCYEQLLYSKNYQWHNLLSKRKLVTKLYQLNKQQLYWKQIRKKRRLANKLINYVYVDANCTQMAFTLTGCFLCFNSEAEFNSRLLFIDNNTKSFENIMMQLNRIGPIHILVINFFNSLFMCFAHVVKLVCLHFLKSGLFTNLFAQPKYFH